MQSNAAASQGRQINILTSDVAPPHAVYLTADDTLVVAAQCLTALAVVVTVRILLADGSISQGVFQPIFFSGGVINFKSFTLGEGFLLGVTVESVGTTVRRGQMYMWVTLVRGAPTFLNFTQTLCQGYVTTQSAVFWPDGTNETSFSGRGNIRSIVGTTPAAGAEISETVPTGVMWRVIAFNYNCLTSATVGNRQPMLTYTDGSNVVAQMLLPSLQAASIANQYKFGDGFIFTTGFNGVMSAPLVRDCVLPSGFVIQTLTLGIQAGDQYTGVRYLVEEWQQT